MRLKLGGQISQSRLKVRVGVDVIEIIARLNQWKILWDFNDDEIKDNGQNRIRTLDSELQPQSLTKPSTQGGTQIYSDPDLAKVVTAWPALSAGLKAAIVAIVQSK